MRITMFRKQNLNDLQCIQMCTKLNVSTCVSFSQDVFCFIMKGKQVWTITKQLSSLKSPQPFFHNHVLMFCFVFLSHFRDTSTSINLYTCQYIINTIRGFIDVIFLICCCDFGAVELKIASLQYLAENFRYLSNCILVTLYWYHHIS